MKHFANQMDVIQSHITGNIGKPRNFSMWVKNNHLKFEEINIFLHSRYLAVIL